MQLVVPLSLWSPGFLLSHSSTVQGNISTRRITAGQPGSGVININFAGVDAGRTRNGRTDSLSVGMERVMDRFTSELLTGGVFMMAPAELSYAVVKAQLDQKFDVLTPQQLPLGIVLYPVGTTCYTATSAQPIHQAGVVAIQPVPQPNQAAIMALLLQMLAGGGAPAAGGLQGHFMAQLPAQAPPPPPTRNQQRNQRRRLGGPNQYQQFGGEDQQDDEEFDVEGNPRDFF